MISSMELSLMPNTTTVNQLENNLVLRDMTLMYVKITTVKVKY